MATVAADKTWRTSQVGINPHPYRVEKCACGGWIVAVEGDQENIAANIRVHNLTPSHQEWRARRCACWGER